MDASGPRGDTVLIRAWSSEDSLEELTTLLHAAYAPLATAGMRFVASHQSREVTARRIARGECLIARRGDRIVGTITLVPPGNAHAGCEYYTRPGVCTLHQFAVEPSLQRLGIGGELLRRAEERARELGATVAALDTAKTAADLIARYQRWGYRIVDRADWRPKVNYESVVLAKELTRKAQRLPSRDAADPPE